MESGGPSVPPRPVAGEYPPPPGGYAPAEARARRRLVGRRRGGRRPGARRRLPDRQEHRRVLGGGRLQGGRLRLRGHLRQGLRRRQGRGRGRPAPSAGEQAGKEEGAKAGFEKGKAQGEAEGTAAGAKAALGGLTNWDTNAHYIIRVAGGPSDEVPYVISTRTADAGRRQLRAVPERPDGRLRQAARAPRPASSDGDGASPPRRPYRPRPLRKTPGPLLERADQRAHLGQARTQLRVADLHRRHRVLQVGERLVGVEGRLDGGLDEALRPV